MTNYIRFDWAMKRLLRDKANYAVLEGLLTTLLNEKITIKNLLESESNQEDQYDKLNRVREHSPITNKPIRNCRLFIVYIIYRYNVEVPALLLAQSKVKPIKVKHC